MRWLLKRWWLWAGTVGAAFVIAALCAAFLWAIPVSVSQINQTNCDKIQRGWTAAQVLALLGDNEGGPIDDETEVAGWSDSEGNNILVTFDSKRRVTDK